VDESGRGQAFKDCVWGKRGCVFDDTVQRIAANNVRKDMDLGCAGTGIDVNKEIWKMTEEPKSER